MLLVRPDLEPEVVVTDRGWRDCSILEVVVAGEEAFGRASSRSSGIHTSQKLPGLRLTNEDETAIQRMMRVENLSTCCWRRSGCWPTMLTGTVPPVAQRMFDGRHYVGGDWGPASSSAWKPQ